MTRDQDTLDLDPPPRTPAQEPARPADGSGRVDRVVLVYAVVAVAWIVGSSAMADTIAARVALPVEAVEIAKGVVFVLVTALALRLALRRWARRVAEAAEVERRALRELQEFSESRTRFLRSVSHELRTPLTSIVGYGMTIQQHAGRLEPNVLEHLSDRLVLNARRLERLVLDLLDLDQVVRGEDRATVETVRVDALVNAVVARTSCDGYLLVVEAPRLRAELDRGKTERIVEELLRNAVRHTPRGTRIRLAVASEDRTLRLRVDDDGPGVDPSVVSAVFEPFTQGDRASASASPGLGIGLSLVRRYAEVQGGTVTLESGPERGTRVEVVLPLNGSTAAGARTEA